jgi:hypothetical protein
VQIANKIVAAVMYVFLNLNGPKLFVFEGEEEVLFARTGLTK